MADILKQEIKFLPGVGPRRAELFQKELGISTFNDLLHYFPYKYIDRTRFYKIKELRADMPYVQMMGRIVGTTVTGPPRKKRFIARFSDGTDTLDLLWFQGIRWVKDSFSTNKTYIVFGRPSVFNGKINLVHPEIEEEEKVNKRINAALQAQYSTTETLKKNFLTSRVIQKLQNTLLQQVHSSIRETLPETQLKKHHLISRSDALLHIHFPGNNTLLQKARFRLKFEELFFIQLNLLRQKVYRDRHFKGYIFDTVGAFLNGFYNHHLHFTLTNAQKRVIREIRHDLGSGKQMNRLLQGDVGSGKTLVALMVMLIAADNGYQSCLMAPTEILANQHFETIQSWTKGLGIEVALLTGSTKKKIREPMHVALKEGKIHILIGTHALLEDEVQFKRLGLVVVDEQHRFGVAQRARLWEKSDLPPHVLVMTATPIPRTLAMTLYGDLEISVIDELPPGRKPIQTLMFNDARRLPMFQFLRKQIAEGRQIYVVFPLIKESESMDYKDLEDGYAGIVEAFPPPKYAVSVVHGKMKPEEKDLSMKYFIEGKTHIMVATTVIEVGVDVPNATVMVIESAERFGLSQLHQLRGRVGRGADQSYCILMASHKLTHEARKRLEIMLQTTDGFVIADADLKIRGPGDLEGTQQSGIPFTLHIANLGQDGQILQLARDEASQILTTDPELTDPTHKVLVEALKNLSAAQRDYSRIS